MACQTCINYRPNGTCHRYPPGLLANQTRIWPTVDPDDECGEYDLRHDLWVQVLELDQAERKWWRFWE